MTFSSDRLKSYCFLCCVWLSFWDIARQKQLLITYHVGMFCLHVIPILMRYLTVISSLSLLSWNLKNVFAICINDTMVLFCSCLLSVRGQFMYALSSSQIYVKQNNYALQYSFRCAIKADSFWELKELQIRHILSLSALVDSVKISIIMC